MPGETHAYCPACREESAIDRQGRCLWCEGPTEQRKPRKKRGGWKRPDLRGSRYTEAQLRALHAAHLQGRSVNSLAKDTYAKVGYGSASSAATAIGREWKRLGLAARDRVEQVRLTCTVHGMAPKHGSRAGYSKFRRKKGIGGWSYRPVCEAVRTQAPRKGEPCDRPAMEGSSFCHVHDPARREQVERITAEMRRRVVREPLPIEPFLSWLRSLHAEHGTWRAVGELLQADPTLLHRFHRQPRDTIERRTVAKYAEAAGLDVEDIYAADPVTSQRRGG